MFIGGSPGGTAGGVKNNNCISRFIIYSLRNFMRKSPLILDIIRFLMKWQENH